MNVWPSYTRFYCHLVVQECKCIDGEIKNALLLEVGNVAMSVSIFKLLNDSCNEYNVKVADNELFS